MHSNFMDAVRARSDRAIASGDLRPIEAEQVVIEDRGLPFIVRWVAALAAKDAAKRGAVAGGTASSGGQAVTLPGGPRDPDFNPFLKPDPALLVEPGTPLSDVLARPAFRRSSHVVVVDAARRPLGVVSLTDLQRRLEADDLLHTPWTPPARHAA